MSKLLNRSATVLCIVATMFLFFACSNNDNDEELNHRLRIGVKSHNGYSLAYGVSNSENWKFDLASFTEHIVKGESYTITASVYYKENEDDMGIKVPSYSTSNTVWYVDKNIGYFNGTPGTYDATGPSVELTVTGNTGAMGIFTFELDNMKSGTVVKVVNSINKMALY